MPRQFMGEWKKGLTDQTANIFIQNTSGNALTGLVYNSAGLAAYMGKQRTTLSTLTLATLSAIDSAHADGGFKEISSSLSPGSYRLDIPDYIFSTNGWAYVTLKGASTMEPMQLDFFITERDPTDAVRQGMTGIVLEASIPSAVWQALLSGGEFGISGSAGESLKAFLAAPNVNVTKIAGSTGAASALSALHDSVELGTCQSGSTSTTIKLATAASSTDDFYRDAAIVVTGATGAKQVRKITGYVGSTRVATVDTAWKTTPDNTSVYAILGRLV